MLGCVDLRLLDMSNNNIGDLGLARLVDVVRPDKTRHDVPGGFLIELLIEGNAQPLNYFRNRSYNDLHEEKIEAAKAKVLESCAYFPCIMISMACMCCVGMYRQI